MTLLIIILCIALAVLLFKKKISSLFNSDIEKIIDLNYTNDEITYLITKYSEFNSDDLVKIIEEHHLADNDIRAIKKVLSDRNFIIPYK